MDLLTSEGWLPSYNIAAILLQIRLAISSTSPPARLAYGSQWNQYGFFSSACGVDAVIF